MPHAKPTCSFLSKDAQGVVGQVETGIVESQTAVQGRDALELVQGEVERHNVKVLGETIGVVGLGDDGNAALGGPAEEDLGGGLAVLVGESLDGLGLEEGLGAVGSLGEDAGELLEALRA